MIDVKELWQLALQAGRRLQSPQTGFVHYYYQHTADEPHHTIPIQENVLFALALLRSRTIENMNEAKKLLEKMIPFFVADVGLFPIYIHEYPNCYDAYLGVQLLAPLYWIIKDFQQILGHELKEKLTKIMCQLLDRSLKSEKPFPPSLAVRLKAATKVMDHQGIKEQQEPLALQINDSWFATHHLADMCIALHMLDQKDYPSFWSYLSSTWHQASTCYIGPYIKELQEQKEPMPGLYDLFLGLWSGTVAQRALQFHLFHLQAVLIQPFQIEWITPASELKGLYQQAEWEIHQHSDWGYSLLTQKQPPSLPTYTPLQIVWGDFERTHTFACQGGKATEIYFKPHPQWIDLEFILTGDVSFDHQQEICFYLDYQPEVSFLLKQQSTNTFALGDTIVIQAPTVHVHLTFNLLEGEGDFLGHIHRSNRPAMKKSQRFQAYDWSIFLRTIRRGQRCRLGCTVAVIAV